MPLNIPARPSWLALLFACVGLSSHLLLSADPVKPVEIQEIIAEGDLTFKPGEVLRARLVVAAGNITIDGNGATLVGPGTVGDEKSLAAAGSGIRIVGMGNVTIKNLNVKGFAVGLEGTDTEAMRVEGCNFSDNYHNPAHGWGELPPRGGAVLTRVRNATLCKNKANRVWDGIHMTDCDDNLVADNDCSYCSNVCLKLWHSSRNRLSNNNLSYGIRIDRAKGEVHARDSTGVLIETGSNDNYWYRNDVTHGGDGIFVRVLNGWVSTGNVFVENDTSYANNNCIESWSPGNTYIRNKANRGSYGFWLGGSDDTRLIGNEAAFNGLPDGYHQAPEPLFGHGGIVCVGGPGSHLLLDGNHTHHNAGGGIVFRGDVGSKGKSWKTRHWVVVNNRSHDNIYGIHGQYATDIYMANNTIVDNKKPDFLDDVTDIRRAKADAGYAHSPRAILSGPTRTAAGKPAKFDLSRSLDPKGGKLGFHWDIDGKLSTTASAEHTFALPGNYRVSATVDNGTGAALAWKDVIVTDASTEELGTEGQSAAWGAAFTEDGAKRGRMQFDEDDDAVVGKSSLKFRPDPYPGAFATAIYPGDKSAKWDWTGKTKLTFWIRADNPNIPAWQDVGPVITLFGAGGDRVIKPKTNLLSSGESESRWSWRRVEVPLDGGPGWTVETATAFEMKAVRAVGIGLDSWGNAPFTVRIDGLAVR